jgi:hypothetical protein
VDVGDRWHEADRVDTGGVREPGGAVDKGEPGDRGAVQAQQLERFVRTTDIYRAHERRPRRLHLHDDREERQRTRAHQVTKHGVDLL